MTHFFRGIETLFVDYLFLPFDYLRRLGAENWTASNAVNWILFLIGIVAAIYWMGQLRKFEENKDISAHSFL